jgi:ABC-type nitrate/sulfonate/bicarbonate transport system substrate-binding protein
MKAVRLAAHGGPKAVRRFVKAWYESVAFMKSHKAETVPLAAKVMGYTPRVAERTYDTLMRAPVATGHPRRQLRYPAVRGRLRARRAAAAPLCRLPGLSPPAQSDLPALRAVAGERRQ